MGRIIEVVPYDPEWEIKFRMEADFLKKVFADELLEVYHIGSTAVPGILAKPIIDLLPVVRDIDKVEQFNPQLEQQGYITKGEFGIPGRRYFVKGSEEKHLFHIHIFQKGSPEITRHLLFREYMRAHPLEAEEYSRLKEELARKYHRDGQAYTQAKSGFIRKIDHKAKIWGERQDFAIS